MIRNHLASIVLAAVLFGPEAQADAPAGRYVLTETTVYDTRTKLTWQRSSSPAKYVWTDARAYCGSLGLDGGGFRLPTIKELLSIVDVTRPRGPTIDVTAFPDTKALPYWSSTPLGTIYWTVIFDIGSTNVMYQGENDVRCVR